MAHGWSSVTPPLPEGKIKFWAQTVSTRHALVRPMVLAMVLVGGAWAAPVQAEELEYEPDVILVIKEKAFHMVKGNAPKENSLHPAFSLSPGQDVTLELRNEDKVPHEFVSPL